MTLSKLIREYVELKIEGEPTDSDWTSIERNSLRCRAYREQLEELEAAIDAAVEPKAVV